MCVCTGFLSVWWHDFGEPIFMWIMVIHAKGKKKEGNIELGNQGPSSSVDFLPAGLTGTFRVLTDKTRQGLHPFSNLGSHPSEEVPSG